MEISRGFINGCLAVKIVFYYSFVEGEILYAVQWLIYIAPQFYPRPQTFCHLDDRRDLIRHAMVIYIEPQFYPRPQTFCHRR